MKEKYIGVLSGTRNKKLVIERKTSVLIEGKEQLFSNIIYDEALNSSELIEKVEKILGSLEPKVYDMTKDQVYQLI